MENDDLVITTFNTNALLCFLISQKKDLYAKDDIDDIIQKIIDRDDNGEVRLGAIGKEEGLKLIKAYKESRGK